jgi:hypothetical protein
MHQRAICYFFSANAVNRCRHDPVSSIWRLHSFLTSSFMWWPSWLHLPLVDRIHWPDTRTIRYITYGVIIGASISTGSHALVAHIQARRRKAHEHAHGFEARPIELRTDEVVSGVLGLVGNTPLVRIESLSEALGCEILGKAEWFNPGGSVKDRVALRSRQISAYAICNLH